MTGAITVTLQVGNSDDKLTQKEWSSFVGEIDKIIASTGFEIHFSGFSNPNAPWQNACWVVVGPDMDSIQDFLNRAKNCSMAYRQESIAATIGTTGII